MGFRAMKSSRSSSIHARSSIAAANGRRFHWKNQNARSAWAEFWPPRRPLLGDDKVALDWLRARRQRFDGRTPMQMLCTETGGRLVEQMLLQIDEGMFA